MRKYRKDNSESLRIYERNRKRPSNYSATRRWKKKNPLKVHAERLLANAVKHGKIKRLPCEICGNPKSVAHHPDYKREFEVIFLCHVHHRKLHYGSISE